MSEAVTTHRRLDPVALNRVLELVDAAIRADGVAPFGEQALLQLRRPCENGTTLLVGSPDRPLSGAAHLTGSGSAELVVHPAARRRGVGRRLVDAVQDAAGPALDIWSHGRLPAAAAMATRLGYQEGRVLLQLRRTLADDVPAVVLPPGVRLRTFVPGADDAAWLRVNARAFAEHAEQGDWTAAELSERQAEAWFDPGGFLLAVSGEGTDETLLGFHWTKVHPGAGVDGAPMGEVYVLGVDPDAQGRGLGPALTRAGLHNLRGRGLDQVLLYTDESNAAAVGMYEQMGFTRWAVDVTYHRPR